MSGTEQISRFEPTEARPAAGPRRSGPEWASDTTIRQGGEADPANGISSHAVVVPVDNIDTDQIIPARFLKITDKEGLAEALFFAWRQDPDFILNSEHGKTARILVAGDNFGCGSSREHAPWALKAFGFRAIIATSFADIFRNNALKNGLLPIAVSPEIAAELMARVPLERGLELTVDLESQTLTFMGIDDAERIERFPIEPFSKKCLLEGLDELGYLVSHTAAIAAFERRAGE